VAVNGPGASLIDASVPAIDRSAQLTNYPTDMLHSPPQTLEAALTVKAAPSIERRPEWLRNRAQDQRRYSGATREPVRQPGAKGAQQRALYRERRQRARGQPVIVMQHDLL